MAGKKSDCRELLVTHASAIRSYVMDPVNHEPSSLPSWQHATLPSRKFVSLPKQAHTHHATDEDREM